jgi:hypothetical protein
MACCLNIAWFPLVEILANWYKIAYGTGHSIEVISRLVLPDDWKCIHSLRAVLCCNGRFSNCNSGLAIMELPFWTCNSGLAILVLQFWTCNSGLAILDLQLQLQNCNSGLAILDLQFWTCNSGLAIMDMQFWTCNYSSRIAILDLQF